MHTKLFVRHIVKMLRSLEHVRIGLNDLKTVTFVSDKKCFGYPAAVRKGQVTENRGKVVENDGKYFD